MAYVVDLLRLIDSRLQYLIKAFDIFFTKFLGFISSLIFFPFSGFQRGYITFPHISIHLAVTSTF